MANEASFDLTSQITIAVWMKIAVYADGRLDASGSASGTISTNNYEVRIGENAQATGRQFYGLLGDVRVYDRGLPAEAVQDLYFSGLGLEIRTPSEDPAESVTSPAWIEGIVTPYATSVTVSVDGGEAFDATRMDGKH